MADNFGGLAAGIITLAGATMLLGWTARMAQGWQQHGFVQPREFVRAKPARKPAVQRKSVGRKAPVQRQSGKAGMKRAEPVLNVGQPMYRSPWARSPERRI
jgi:hypothetical protein